MNKRNVYVSLGIFMFQIIVLQPAFVNAQDKVNSDTVAQTIEKMKGAKSWPEMANLITTLCEFGKPVGGDILKEFQNKENDKWLRKVLAEVLSELKDEETIPGIVSILRDEKETPFIRSEAAFSLGMMGYLEASGPLREQLKNSNAEIRSMAVFCLGLLKDKSAISAIGIMIHDKDEIVRNRVATALGKLEDPSVIVYLEPLLKDKDQGVRLATIQSLGMIGTEKSVDLLSNSLSTASDQTEKVIAIQALGKTKEQKGGDILLDILKNEDSYLAMNAAKALAEIGDKRALPFIKNRIETAIGSDVFTQKILKESYDSLNK